MPSSDHHHSRIVTDGEGKTLVAILTALEPENVCAYLVIAVRHDSHLRRVVGNIHPTSQQVFLLETVEMMIAGDASEVVLPDEDGYTDG